MYLAAKRNMYTVSVVGKFQSTERNWKTEVSCRYCKYNSNKKDRSSLNHVKVYNDVQVEVKDAFICEAN